MTESIQIKDLGNNVHYVHLGEKGHLMIGRDHANQHIGRLIDLEVKESERGKGLASMLIADALRQLQKNGITQVEVDVLSTNDAALRLYEKLGFEQFDKEQIEKETYLKLRRSTDI